MRNGVSLVGALLGLVLASAASSQNLDIPIRVFETANLARYGTYVTTGVPLPLDQAIRSVNRLGVFDESGHQVPAQFKVLARWHGAASDTTKPIKWLLVTMHVEGRAGAREVFWLRDENDLHLPEGNMVTATSSGVRVDTGPLKFTISKQRGNLFDTLSVLGRPVLQSSNSSGFVIRDHNGNRFSSAAIAPTSIVVEENGTHRAVIKVTGTHSDGQNSLLEYTIRIHVFARETDVRVFYSLRNPNSYGYASTAGPVYLQDVQLDLACRLGTQPVAVAFRDENYTLGAGQARELQQDMAGATSTSAVTDTNLNLHDNFIRRIVDENATLIGTKGGMDDGDETGRDPGYMNVFAGDAGVVVGLRDFWQNFPKSLTARGDGSISVGLLPTFGEYVDDGYYQRAPAPASATDDYTFGGGRQKTHEIFLHFYAAGDDPGFGAVERFNAPLIAMASPDAYLDSRAIQYGAHVEDWYKNPQFSQDTAIDFDRWERFQRMKWDPIAVDYQSLLGHVTYHEFRRRGGTWGARQFYGWMNYGDTPWGDGYCQGHYDWPFATLFSAIRGQDPELFTLGNVMARHRMDIDQYHTTADRSNISGGQRFEKGEHHGDMTVPPTPSHTWIHGMLLYWAMTGDEFAKEAALETLAFYDAYWSRMGAPTYGLTHEARTGGWSLMGLTELYDYCYEPRALQLAKRIVQAFVNYENAENTSGYYLAGNSYQMPWMLGIYMNGLGKYYHHTGQRDRVAGQLLDRMAKWFTSGQNGFGPLAGGTGARNAYTPYTMWYFWHPDPNQRSQMRRVNMAHIIDGLSYAYLATGTDTYQDTALAIGSDLWRYYSSQSTTLDRDDPKELVPITMRPTTYPRSESKILGWLSRYGKIVHFAEYMRRTAPPIVCEVFPKKPADGWTSLRFRVTRNQPIAPEGWRTYSGQLRVGSVDVTDVVSRYFRRDGGAFRETWFAPVLFGPGDRFQFDLLVWDGPWVHQVVQSVGSAATQ